MPDNTDDFDLDDDETGNGPAQLRSALKKTQKELREAQQRIQQFEVTTRQATIESVLREKNANPAIAKFVAKDLNDVSPETVNAWLAENGELFGYTEQTPETDPVAQQAARISQASALAPPAQTGVTLEGLRTMSDDELIRLGYLPPKPR